MPDKLKKTEFWLALAGILGALAAAVLESGLIAPTSTLAVIIGIVVIVSSYIGGRSWEKAARAGRAANVRLYSSGSVEAKPDER